MLVTQAREAARRWVLAEAGKVPGFCGAYYAGSVTWLPDDAVLPATSDLDVMVVLADANPPLTPGKLIYEDVLLEVSYIARDRLASPEQVLGDYHLAGAFRTPSIIVDPSGHLTALQAAVAREYARRQWVRRRCEHAADEVRRWARSLDEAAPLQDQVAACGLAAGGTTHVLLVAALENPTVRRRYAAVREVLTAYGRLDTHEPLLALLGCAAMDRPRVEHHLDAVTAAFDAAKVAIKTPYRFGSDISDAARPISIDGSRELIERGLHREAVFWIVATFSRCRAIFAADAPDLLARFDRDYRELLANLGIGSVQDRHQRCAEVEAFLPRLWAVAEETLAANRQISE
jgi:hypothetical protein